MILDQVVTVGSYLSHVLLLGNRLLGKWISSKGIEFDGKEGSKQISEGVTRLDLRGIFVLPCLVLSCLVYLIAWTFYLQSDPSPGGERGEGGRGLVPLLTFLLPVSGWMPLTDYCCTRPRICPSRWHKVRA